MIFNIGYRQLTRYMFQANLLFSMTCMLRKVRYQVFIILLFPVMFSDVSLVRAIVYAECKSHVDSSKMEYRHVWTFIVFWEDAIYMFYIFEKKWYETYMYICIFPNRLCIYAIFLKMFRYIFVHCVSNFWKCYNYLFLNTLPITLCEKEEDD